MAFLSLLAEAKDLARAIYQFQRDMGNKKAFCINSILQKLVNRIATTKLFNLLHLDVPKRKTRVASSVSSRFYDYFWLTDPDKFSKIVARFEQIMANSQIIDSFLQQSITSAVTFTVAMVVATI